MKLSRSAGILMPFFSLPSSTGIGTFGRSAFDFVDFLHAAGQKYWQMLPMGPTGFGDSPYQSCSSYAGNPFFIDPGLLCGAGYITEDELRKHTKASSGRIDYDFLRGNRPLLLELAADRASKDPAFLPGFDRFCEQNRSWLDNYALFLALKEHFGGASWTDWPDETIKRRSPEAVALYSSLLAGRIRFHKTVQYFFFSQLEALRSYALSKNVKIIGDVPVYVPMDSADVWSEPHFFQLTDNFLPKKVSGVPPDYFNENGQLWGNPLYDYDAMERDGFGWWIRRIDGVSKFCDVIRIDHFRGFEAYWSVPADAKTARDGCWVKGPGMRLVGTLTSWFADLSFIAEDLGSPSEGLTRMLRESGLPGMRVLQFAFDGFDPAHPSTYLPFMYPENCICYTGTHDNDTFRGKMSSDPEAAAACCRYLDCTEDELTEKAIRLGLASPAVLFIAPLQDYLDLPSDARVNVPGDPDGNWRWQLQTLPDAAAAEKIRSMTELYSRLDAQAER